MGITVWALARRPAPEGVHPDQYSVDLGLKFSEPRPRYIMAELTDVLLIGQISSP